MSFSHIPPGLDYWFSVLASVLDPRSGPRLVRLLAGAFLARGRRTVTSWIRAAGLSSEYRPCYTTLAAVTDYDAWHDEHEAVDAKSVFAVLQANVDACREAIRQLVPRLATLAGCGCRTTLDAALVTARGAISQDSGERLEPILRRRLGGER